MENKPDNKSAGGAPEKKPDSPPENKENPAPPPTGHNRKPLDFDKGARILKTTIAKLSDDAAKIRGNQSAAWKQIEDLSLNKKAAKHIQSMLSQSPATVSDYLRTFIGLLSPCGLGIIRDMVGKSGIMVPLIDSPSVDV